METEYLSASEIIGHGTMVGEVTDPKCLFGVMKPGYGKPHRSCAARCIAGGIPPVLKVQSKSGTTDYYILVQHDGRPANDFIFPFVGDQIVACGEVRQVGDWKFFYLKNDSAPLRVPEGLRFITSHCAT